MSTGILLLSMAACGLVTFLIRLSFIASANTCRTTRASRRPCATCRRPSSAP